MLVSTGFLYVISCLGRKCRSIEKQAFSNAAGELNDRKRRQRRR
jgi:hypothetical protein